MYDQFKTLLEQRRTPRLVTTEDISQENIQKILAAAVLAPSFDKAYAYEIHALTNTADGIAKKEALLNYYRCLNTDGSHSKVTDSFNDREMVQPILSGLTLVYVVTPKNSPTMRCGPAQTLMFSVKDATVSATYAMLAAESLGLKSGMFGSIDHNYHPDDDAIRLFSTDPNAVILLSVAIANTVVDIPETSSNKHFFDYKGERPYVMYKKHRDIRKHPKIIRL